MMWCPLVHFFSSSSLDRLFRTPDGPGDPGPGDLGLPGDRGPPRVYPGEPGPVFRYPPSSSVYKSKKKVKKKLKKQDLKGDGAHFLFDVGGVAATVFPGFLAFV